MITAYSFWDVAPVGTSFTIPFPKKIEKWPDACCLSGKWTITKIEPMYLAEFREDDPMLVIPEGKATQIVAIATCKGSHSYYLTRKNLRNIIEWAERERIEPQVTTPPKQLEAGLKQIDTVSIAS